MGMSPAHIALRILLFEITLYLMEREIKKRANEQSKGRNPRLNSEQPEHIEREELDEMNYRLERWETYRDTALIGTQLTELPENSLVSYAAHYLWLKPPFSVKNDLIPKFEEIKNNQSNNNNNNDEPEEFREPPGAARH